ncbi:2-aminoethylphosphonate--pyruvate transaminase [Paenibacillus segetis]|uniref:2-aminoethylphosphonate--pyruvate transaminase n=1 Tax=Paenibacillus segetis TaxID=1325360 RepID=A0ABQ1YEA2_9BACL|nr:2-aminoethylphosphonate--pyruvate transaminase [Paenibacillus segetis]GGH23054.1 2-aminoethylphosphonate--pyruvate transaminase [Paenibacillus segetis]
MSTPYLLLTPGPLSTSASVKEAMLRDSCTWDEDYNQIVQGIRQKLVDLATLTPEKYTSVLMQGSGSFCVEAVIGSSVPANGKLLVLTNGAYGKRIAQIAQMYGISTSIIDFGEVTPVTVEPLIQRLVEEPDITHVAVVHCETTTGLLNPIEEVGQVVKEHGKVYIVDAMSSFGGIPLDMHELGIDYLISSANKCIQGVPGFGFIIANREELQQCKGISRSLSLDIYDQWETMESGGGKWRFTSPTHVVHAFKQALQELEEEGGVAARYVRYKQNQDALAIGMERLGYRSLLPKSAHSPIITSFLYPDSEQFNFQILYHRLKHSGFVIYPGKISAADTFRIGNIGEIYLKDIHRLLEVMEENCFW